MKLFKSAVLISLFCLAFSGAASAQVCGDANSDNNINILDMILILDYVAGKPNAINLANADCDGVPGVTIYDMITIWSKAFQGLPMDCTPAGAYSFADANNDTIYVPRLVNIPEEVNKVNLLVFGSFSSVTDGFFMPTKEIGAGASANFDLTGILVNSRGIGGGTIMNSNERSIFLSDNFDYDQGFLNGGQNLAVLTYERTAPGVGAIAPEPFDRPSPWKIAIARNDDLIVPLIQHYDLISADGGLDLSAQDFHFHSLQDAQSLDTFQLNISQGPYGVAFTVESSVPWILADQYSGVTPATVTFLAHGSGIGIGDFNGVIRVSYANVGFLPVDSVNLAFTVHPSGNPTFPAGDVNCDQAFNILDLTHIVDFIFRGGTRPFPCEK